jgi:hypothetical protein
LSEGQGKLWTECDDSINEVIAEFIAMKEERPTIIGLRIKSIDPAVK